MRRIKLTKYERQVEKDLVQGVYRDVPKAQFDEIVRALELRRKNAVLNIRINRGDLESLKLKAKKLGVKYQTFIAELLHRVAHS